MKQIILGTAGHIDHGKTSLIKAISGTDTDRLKEEKERGITIELGFAALDLPSGQHLGIVDVPGHEKFVKNMVAGATGIDIVMMVIAADEGVMPQTREHMEICTLLGIQHGLIALTKTDMVEEEWLELALEDIREFSQGTFLEDAPILPVSSATGNGIPELISALDDIAGSIPQRPPSSLFRLPIDRVFTMKGFGTVITGTLVSGKISVGETIMVYPSGITSKVRGIQVHNQSAESAEAGMRTAINFQGLDRAAVQRGEVLSTPGALVASYMVDVSFHYLASNPKPLKNRTPVRFHTGTSEIMGYLILLDQEELPPGQTGVAQLRLESPVAIVKDDRFVVRSYSPVRTIGGGQVLNPIPMKHKRLRPDVVEGLEHLADENPEAVISQQIQQAGFSGVSFSHLKIMTNLTDKQLETALQHMLSQQTIIQTDKENRIFLHQATFDTLIQNTTDYLAAYHTKNPLKAGMPKEELKSKFPQLSDVKIFNLALGQMIKSGRIVQEEKTVRLADHSVSLGADQADIRKKILNLYKDGGLQPPYFRDVPKLLEVDPNHTKDVMLLLVEDGQIVKTKDDLYFHIDAIKELKNRLVGFLKANEEITTPQFKEMTGASRKYVIPLIEYFDASKVTLRIGDSRKLRGS
ncbi:MAG: selenocysteine-specific translation elongation factor [Deltaproteobacteria bacterium]|nr:selenocysteine-specific translation elongation factor [Deltaproteobacteria bacterium]MBW2481496.1 selenocysteine-specific translation elongation factor [Deltaproteobacteria bacterium]